YDIAQFFIARQKGRRYRRGSSGHGTQNDKLTGTFARIHLIWITPKPSLKMCLTYWLWARAQPG
ncbi:hypothetical protein N9R76_03185, partial [Planktomarina temperata]|nr:hypothetical protein [Planktomarina temperata]